MRSRTVSKYNHRWVTIFKGEDGKYRLPAGVSSRAYGSLDAAKKAIDRYIEKNKLKLH